MQILEIYNNGNNCYTYWINVDGEVYAIRIDYINKESKIIYNENLTKEIYVKLISKISFITSDYNGRKFIDFYDVKLLRGEYCNRKHTERKNIHIGKRVLITLKNDQRTDKRVVGTVKRILTSKPKHSQGIKVMLHDGQVGRVQAVFE